MKLSTVFCFGLLHAAEVRGFLKVYTLDSVELDEAVSVGLSSVGAHTEQMGAVHSSFVKSIQEMTGVHFPTKTVDDDSSVLVRIRTLTSSTQRHVDAICADTHTPWRTVSSMETVAFLPLDTNPDSYFDYNDECVPLVKGSLVRFDGSVAHNTIIKSGSVRLLGPFNLESMTRVEIAPTSSPTDAPTPVDSDGDGVPDNLDGTAQFSSYFVHM